MDGDAWMGCMDGMHGWGALMGCMDGLNGWDAWMGMHGWGCMDGIHGWDISNWSRVSV